jgi:hypothetical protein
MLGQLFSKETQAIFFNYKEKPVQRMLDFDFVCGRGTLHVAFPLSLLSAFARALLERSGAALAARRA